MSNLENALLALLSNATPDKIDEIIKLDNWITSYKPNKDYSSKIYSDIFILLVETRWEWVKEVEPDYMYILKAFQATRLLARNSTIQTLMFNETHWKIYETILDKLIRITPVSNVIECILIEWLTWIKRYIYPDSKEITEENKENYIEKIVTSSMTDNMIQLLNTNNITLMKLLKYIFRPLLANHKVISKFTKTKTVEIIINGIKRHDDINSENTIIYLDILINLIHNNDFRNIFIFWNGNIILIQILKQHPTLEKEFKKKFCFEYKRFIRTRKT